MSPRLLRRFELPSEFLDYTLAWASGWRTLKASAPAGLACMAPSSLTSASMHFYPDPAKGLVTLTHYAHPTDKLHVFVIDACVFRLPDAGPEQPQDTSHIAPQDEWGPRHTRCFPGLWNIKAYGSRFVLAGKGTVAGRRYMCPLTMYNFSPYAVERADRTGRRVLRESSALMGGSLPCVTMEHRGRADLGGAAQFARIDWNGMVVVQASVTMIVYERVA